ncbi:MAG: thioredoxin domain-containing protein, partial [Anaerolineae bacterium]
YEIAIVGDPAAADTSWLLAEVRRRYLPTGVLACAAAADAASQALIPLLAGREPIGGRATAYVCRNYVCHLPVVEPAALADQLDARTKRP